jgi:hypothetical protein
MLNWSLFMAKYPQVLTRNRLTELPAIELVAIEEDPIRAAERRLEVYDLLARIHLLSKKRGRPSLKQDSETYAA